MTQEKEHILITATNIYECMWLILVSWLKKLKLLTIPFDLPEYAADRIKRVPFLKRYMHKSVKEFNEYPKEYAKFYYKLNRETIELTSSIYERCIKNKNNIVKYYNKTLKTVKFEPYLKNSLSFHVHYLLQGLHLVRLSGCADKHIIMADNPINRYITAFIERRYKAKYNVRWVLPLGGLAYLLIYYRWLIAEFIRRGLVFNRRKKSFKLAKEAVWGLDRLTCRDDFILDNKRFKIDDILLLEFNPNHSPRARVFESVKEKGFHAVSAQKLKINVNKNITGVLFFYFLVPLISYIRLSLQGEKHLFYYIYLFHKNAFPIEVLMNLYDIGCYLSSKDWGDVEETIIFNKYNTKNAICHWSDLTSFDSFDWNFVAHNIYFTWGDRHYDSHSANWFIDKRINIGCMYKSEFNIAERNKSNIKLKVKGLNAENKVVTFFDTSFDNASQYPELFFLEYLEIIKEVSQLYPDVNILLKPKIGDYEKLLSSENHDRYKRLWSILTSCGNFIYLEPAENHFEEILTVSDVCVSMGMNSPSTVGLICGKDALYFDNTGNYEHPFVSYTGQIVFRDKKLLIKQIDNILNGRFRCKDVISEEEIRSYDAFADDNALERLKQGLCELTSTG